MSDLANIDDLAALFKTDRATVMEWRRRYAWPHTRIGRKFYFTPAQLEQIKKDHAVIPDKAETPITGQTARSAARRRAS